MDIVLDAYLGKTKSKQLEKDTRERIDWLVDSIDAGTVLDIGCSQGILGLLLARRGNTKVIGIDILDAAIADAKRHLANEPPAVQQAVQFLELDFLKDDISDYQGRFDTVVMGQVLEHISEPVAFVARAVSCLSPSGKIVITIPYGVWDHDEHQETFFVHTLYEMLSELVAVTRVELVAGRLAMVGALSKDAQIDAVLPKQIWDLERNFFILKERRLVERAERLSARNALLTEQVESLSARNAPLVQRAERLSTRNALLTEQVESLNARNAALVERAERLSTRNALITEQVESLSARNATLMERAERLSARNALLVQRAKSTLSTPSTPSTSSTPDTKATPSTPHTNSTPSTPHETLLLAASKVTKTLSKARYAFEKTRAKRRPLRKLLHPLHWLRLQLGLQLARYSGWLAQSNANAETVLKRYTRSPEYALLHRNDIAAYFAETSPLFQAYVNEMFGGGGVDSDAAQAAIQGAISEPQASLFRFQTLQSNGDLDQALALCRDLVEGKLGKLTNGARRKLLREPVARLMAKDLLPERTVEHSFVAGGRIGYVVHSSLPFVTAGYATRTQGFADGLRRSGQDIVTFTRPGFPLNINRDLSASDVPLIQEIDNVVYHRILEPIDRAELPNDYLRLAADALEKAFVAENVKTVIAASNYVCSLPAIIAARRLGLPSVYEVRGFWEISAKSKDESFGQTADFATRVEMESLAARAADRVLTLTAGMREELIRRGVEPERIFLAPNGFQPTMINQEADPQLMRKQLNIPEGCPVIGYIGSITPYEGLEDLATACVGLHERGLDFRLLLVGDEKPSKDLSVGITEQIVATFTKAKISDKLIMTGRVPFEMVPDYYSIVDIAPIPRKPFEVSELVSPIKPLEAMAFETALVVSSVAALTEIVTDGVNGYVFEKGNIEALRDTLVRAITDPVTRQQIAAEGKRFAFQERVWENIAKKATEFLFRN